MEDPLTWNPEDWTERESLEAMIVKVGGTPLAEVMAEATEARHAFEGALPPEKRRLYELAADASADASLERENVATRIALVHGVGIGAALVVHGRDEDPELLIDLAATLTIGLLGSPLSPEASCRVAATVLDALRLAGVARAEIAGREGGAAD